jgi:Flp pilus assembly protein TadG
MKAKLLKNRKGQSLVETALVLPVLILILAAIIDFGIMFNNYLLIGNAAREGARSAAIGSTDAQITAKVNQVASLLDSTKLTIVISPNGTTGRTSGNPVTVTVKYTYSMITPVIGDIIPGPFQLKAASTMRCE